MIKDKSIIKIIKSKSKKEIYLDWYYDEHKKIFNNEIKKHDDLFFYCDECNKVASKRVSEIKYDSLLCRNCQSKKTNIKKYGVDNPNKLESIKEKKVKTYLKNYGEKHYFATKEFKKHIKNKYGVSNMSQLSEVKEKVKKTNIEKYGVPYVFLNKDILNKSILSKRKKYYYNLELINNEYIEPLFSEEEYINTKKENIYKFKCKNCGNIFEDHIDSSHFPRCLKCYPKYRSLGEIELSDFVSQYIDIIQNDRELIKPYEIDILIPSLKLGIEFNGNYWHTEKFGRDDEYHKMKIDKMNEKGYNLIMIWEEQWNDNKEEIKNYLLEILYGL